MSRYEEREAITSTMAKLRRNDARLVREREAIQALLERGSARLIELQDKAEA